MRIRDQQRQSSSSSRRICCYRLVFYSTATLLFLFNVGFYFGVGGSFNEIINNANAANYYSKAIDNDVVAKDTSDSNDKHINLHIIKNTSTNEHILQILNASKITITEEMAKQLPTWEDITSMYGDKSVIHGLETCEHYRNTVKPADRTIGPAGLFNTGTNLMYKLLTDNCHIDGKILYQAPWGKHSPASNRLKREAPSGKGVNQTEFFPFMMVKDPFTWMNSQCRHGYGVTFWKSEYDEEHCPNLIRENVRDRDETVPLKLFSGGKFHDTLLDAYNWWYGVWEEERITKFFPHLAIRYEDLLFHGQEVSRIVCDCVGGNVITNFHFESESAKGDSGPHEGSSGLVKALIQYGNPTTRMSGFSDRDVRYARNNNATAKLMKEYAYSYPVL